MWNLTGSGIFENHSEKDYSKAKFYLGKKMQGNCKINADKPAPTIRAEHHGNIEGHYRSRNEDEPDDIEFWRRLSIRECARLQSFPVSFIFNCAVSRLKQRLRRCLLKQLMSY